jgi:hypothetical protein
MKTQSLNKKQTIEAVIFFSIVLTAIVLMSAFGADFR